MPTREEGLAAVSNANLERLLAAARAKKNIPGPSGGRLKVGDIREYSVNRRRLRPSLNALNALEARQRQAQPPPVNLRKPGGFLRSMVGAGVGAGRAAAGLVGKYGGQAGKLRYEVQLPNIGKMVGGTKTAVAAVREPEVVLPGLVANQIVAGLGLTNANSKKQIEEIEKALYSILKNTSITPEQKKQLGEKIGENLAQLIVKFWMLPSTGPGKMANAKIGIKNGLAKNWKNVWIDSGFLNKVAGPKQATFLRWALSNEGRLALNTASFGSTAYGLYTAPRTTAAKLAAGEAVNVAQSYGYPHTAKVIGGLKKVGTAGAAATSAYYYPSVISVPTALYSTYNALPNSFKKQLIKYTSSATHSAAESYKKRTIANMKSNNKLGAPNRSQFFNRYPELKNTKKWFNAANGILGNKLRVNTSTAANGIFNSRYRNKNGQLISYTNYNWNKNMNLTGLTPQDMRVIRALANARVRRDKRWF